MSFDARLHGPIHILEALLAFDSRVATLARTIIIAIVDSLFADYLFWRRAAEADHAATSIQSRVSGITGDLTRIETHLREGRDVFYAVAKEVDLVAWNRNAIVRVKLADVLDCVLLQGVRDVQS
jgi:hypothetical protein